MNYKQPAAVLRQIARTGSAKVRLQAIELLGQKLPRLGRYVSGSPESLLWSLASDDTAAPVTRFKALCQLLILLAQKQKEKNEPR